MNTGRKLFSERMGYEQPKSIQREGMDSDLRSGLWNVFYKCFEDRMSRELLSQKAEYTLHHIFYDIWVDFLKNPADEYRSLACTEFFGDFTYTENRGFAKNIFLSFSWLDVFNLIEYIILNSPDHEKSEFINGCNEVLQKEKSAYRIVEECVTKITSEQEIQSINQAMHVPYDGVKKHIHQALSLFSDRENPDYSNSIKESISAVESLVKEVTGENQGTLGKLINQLNLHPAFGNSLTKLYGFTSDAKGIRHGGTGKPLKIDQNTARFMLITCSAFVNYIISQNPKMPTDRDTYKYHFKIRNRIVHTGITNDLDRREAEHQNEPGWSKGHVFPVGRRTTRDAALEWEREQGKQGKPVRKESA